MPNSVRTYPPTWEGKVVLACRKCQKKLKGEPGMRALAKLKKTMKRRNKEHIGAALHVISVPCMDLCPKGAVTICLPANQPLMLSLLRNDGDIEQLYQAK